METKHSPLPWHTDGGLVVKCVDHGRRYTVCKVGNPRFTDEANYSNAKFIVRACNAHDDLVKALDAVTRCLENWMEIADKEDQRDYDYAAVRQAKAALSKALT